jgi:hypothetical protein
MTRQSYDPDSIYVGDFKGLATAGGSFGADPSYLHTLTNAFVTKDGRLQQRKGSVYLYGTATTFTPDVFQFSFAGERFIIHRYGTQFNIYRVNVDSIGEAYDVRILAQKTNVLRTESAGEPATYAVKNEGNYCHVLIATASTQLVSISLSYRDVVVASTTATTAVAPLGMWYQGSVISQSNSKIFTSNSVSPTTAITNTGNQLTLTWAARPSDVVVGSKLRLFSCFWLRYIDSNYYAGSQFYSTGLRRNTVPLDVNVEVPESVATNAIFNEPIQDLDYETYWLYDTNVSAATRLTKVTNRQPLATNAWDFSDGAYRAVATQITNRTPNYVAFGGLQGNNISNRVYISRLRTILVGAFEYPSILDMGMYVDKVFTPASWHTFNATQITSGEPKYVSFASTVSTAPGVNQEAVVEIVYIFNATNAANGIVPVLVDISRDKDSHRIGDGYGVPLYGYNLVASTKSFSFPNIVRFVGNRLVLSGTDNTILVSSSDWNYRGFSFTNLQVSSLNFSGNSPYLLTVEQNGGRVKTIESVNGVILVASDTGIYRVSGKERNSPPTADTAVISRLTNQTSEPNSFLVAENAVYLANELGLYKVNYVREQDEGVIEDIGLPVSNLFNEKPTALIYSRSLNSLLVKFPSQRKLLAYSLLTKTFYQVHVSIPFDLQLFSTLDGYLFSNGTVQVVATWNKTSTVDLRDFEVFTQFITPALELTIDTTPVSANTLALSPYLLQRYAGSNVALPVYNNQVRAVGSSFILTEQSAGNSARAILSSVVTKTIYTDKLNRGLRLREANALYTGSGTGTMLVADAGSENSNQRLPLYLLTIDSTGRTTITGEQNKASANLAYPSSDTAVVRLGNFGIAEAYVVAFQLSTGLELVGFSLNTSAKTLSRNL